MNYNQIIKLLWDQVIIYLRKSRSDDPNQTVEEVLAKHEAQLQEYALREFGCRIPEENIYREVVSGESIEDRVEIKKVLARIEDPNIKGVLVIEPQRLSRGDLEDCGRLINSLRFTKTQVVTLAMTYDLENKMERKFFQDELLRGRDYLEYTKEILMRGRVAAAKRGCYTGTRPPYGYKKIVIGKDHTLEPIEHEADVVRLIFDLYTKDRLTPYQIACRLNDMGIVAYKGGPWMKDSVRKILGNAHYTGKIVWNYKKTTPVLENGVVKYKRVVQPDEEVIISEGKQPAIISQEAWDAAQAIIANNPRTHKSGELSNPMAGLLYCEKCGRALAKHPYNNADDRYECRTRPRCYKSIKIKELHAALIVALEESELPALELKVKNNDGDALKIQMRTLKKLEKQLAEYREQEEKQYDLLETGRYTQDVFDRRNAALRTKMEECQSQIYKTKKTMPQSVNYEERVMALKAAIEVLKDPTATPLEQNKVLKAILERVDFKSIPSDGRNSRRLAKGEVDPFTITVQLRL